MKNRMRKTLSLLAGVMVAASLASCSDEQTDTETTNGGNNSEETGEILIGFVTPTASETYWTSYISGVEEKAAELGVNIQVTDGMNDANTQLEQINSLIATGVDGIVLTPVDTVSLLDAPKLADDAGIPLITSNRALDMEYGGLDGGSAPLVHVGFNDVAVGEVQGQLVADICADFDPCRVAMILQPLGSTPQLERSEGFMNIVEEHSNIEVVAEQSDNNDANTAMDLTRTILQQNDDLNVIASQYDPSAVAVAQAVEEVGRKDSVQVVGVGGSMDGIAGVESGALTSTVWISPSTDGKTALEAMVAIVKGEELPVAVEMTNNRPTVPVSLVGVNKDNVADYPGEW